MEECMEEGRLKLVLQLWCIHKAANCCGLLW